ncbi:LPS-assembly protein LptD [Hymenobacter oligotrophus]|uniref:LPS-assembly protein LptD n=1 Tax=Hymenobacter oligotrophus TaxID=2319843 RepID=A0A3B7R4I9_9BACT|nr:putative LPS assembly protein LptD [Hymenobacter oligotrophus]AYA38682.1 LPS-assembly protein LptD [Hymenobacter oligotrophus]
MTLIGAHYQTLCRNRRAQPWLLLLGLLLLLCSLSLPAAWAQQRPGRTTPAAVRPDTIRRTLDTVRVVTRKGDIETTVKYQAKDSIRFNVQEKKATLYDKANVDYGDMSLKAGVITVDYNQNILTAEGLKDSTGRVRDKPVFKDAAETYQAGRIAYNFKTRKGKISEAITQQGEGYIHADVVKKNELNEIYGLRGRYTTCNLEHPHFFINASKMKVVPRKQVVTGPFNLVIGDIPTPLGFLFGYFPSPGKSRASGFIIPTFGQAVDRGFYLTNGGYYWAINQYLGLRVTGNVYSGSGVAFGGWGVNTDLTYRKRYRYDGRLDFSYSRRPAGQLLRSESVNTDPNIRRNFKPRTFWLSWTHTPTPRPGGGRFSANVRTGSPEFNQQNTLDVRNYLTPAFNSTVSYQKQLRNLPINYAVQAAQDLNTITGTVNLTLPDVTVGVQRQNLYRLFGLPTRGAVYEQFAVAYQMTGQNRLTNVEQARVLEAGIPLLGGEAQSRTIPVRFDNLRPFLRNAQTAVQHRFDVTLGQFSVLKHFSFTPTVNYGQTWFNKQLEYKYVPAARAVRIDTVRGFNVVHNLSYGASLSTNLYGTVNFKPGGKIQAIRHRLAPSINFTGSPNYQGSKRLFNEVTLGDLRNSSGQLFGTRNFSRYAGFPFAVPSGGRVSQISFGVQNQVEMKVRNKQDTTGNQPYKKVSLIDGFDLNSGYNFAADSLRLAPLSASFRTQVAQKLNLLVSSSFNFYQRDSTGRLIDRYLFETKRLARLDNAAVQLTYQFDSNRRPGQPGNRQQRMAPTNDPVLGNPNQPDSYIDYLDFSIPWTLNASLGALYQDPGPRLSRPDQPRPRAWATVAMTVSGEIKLTDKMRFSYNSGYDFVSNKITLTQLNFFRDLHCWQITGTWTPVGQIQGFSVTIGAKSALLQDLKLNRNRTFLNR